MDGGERHPWFRVDLRMPQKDFLFSLSVCYRHLGESATLKHIGMVSRANDRMRRCDTRAAGDQDGHVVSRIGGLEACELVKLNKVPESCVN